MSHGQRSTTAVELGLLYAVFCVITIFTAIRQKPITYNEGKGWEGVGYYAVADCFMKGVTPAAEGPYVYRLATPWLAAKISQGDLFNGFRIVNVIANALGVALLWLWLRRHIAAPWVRVALVSLYLIQWDAPTRWIWYYPVHTDPLLYVTLFAGLLLIDLYRERPTILRLIGLCALSVVGTLNREVALLIPVALLGVRRPIKSYREVALPPRRDFLPLVFGLAVFGGIKLLVHQTDRYSFVMTVVDFLYNKGIGSFVQGWLLAFGPVLLVAIYDWRRAAAFLRERQDLLIYFAICVAFGYGGGTDTERLLYWAMPVLFVLLGHAFEAHGPTLKWAPLAAMLIAGQIITSRILWTTPDYPSEAAHTFPLLQMIGNHVQFLDLFSYHGFRLKEFVCLVEWVFFGAAFLWLMRWKSDSSKRGVHAPDLTN